MPETAGNELEITPDGIRRLWEYRTSVESSFHQRNSFLLVAESMLLAAFAAVLSVQLAWPWIPRVLAGFGVLLTCAWWYVNARHFANYRDLRAKVEELCPEYAWVRRTRHRRGPSTWKVIAHGVPLLTLLVWALFLANILLSSQRPH